MVMKLVLLQLILGAFFGLSAKLYIGGFLLVSESIDSPRWATRWWYRYCVFSLWFSLALPVTISALGGLGNHFKSLEVLGTSPSIWLLTAVVAALGLYFLDRRVSLYFDPRKVRARKALAAKRA